MYSLVLIGVPMIIGELRRYLRDNNSIRVSRSIRDLAYRVLAVKEKYNKEQQKELTIDEISQLLEVPKEDIVMCLDAIQTPMSLQEPVYGEGAECIYLMMNIGQIILLLLKH